MQSVTFLPDFYFHLRHSGRSSELLYLKHVTHLVTFNVACSHGMSALSEHHPCTANLVRHGIIPTVPGKHNHRETVMRVGGGGRKTVE
jgi:hypothetical protein